MRPPTRVLIDVAIAAALFAGLFALFSPFEAHTPLWIRLARGAIFLAVTAALSWTKGRRWAMTWAIAIVAAGTIFHGWWTHAHGIEFFRPEPRDKYYRLRGWSTDAAPAASGERGDRSRQRTPAARRHGSHACVRAFTIT